MRRTLCKSKIHRATLTGADLHYEGSCTVDRDLMDAADLLPFEKVQLNGAAARLGMPGDLVIVISYGEYEDDELDEAFAPKIVFVDHANRRVPPHSREEFEEGRHEA